jgi:hypothetical protein
MEGLRHMRTIVPQKEEDRLSEASSVLVEAGLLGLMVFCVVMIVVWLV